MEYTIYLHRNKTNGKCYVGQTHFEVNTRWRNGEGYKTQKRFYRAIQKYGWNGFEHIILCKCWEEEVDFLETQFIKKFDSMENGYNCESGGNKNKHYSKEYREAISKRQLGTKRKPHTEESKRKMSESRLGSKHQYYGKHLSEEHKKHLSESLKGRKHSQETKNKIGQGNRGLTRSKESRIKMCLGKTKIAKNDLHHIIARKNCYQVRILDIDKAFKTIEEAKKFRDNILSSLLN